MAIAKQSLLAGDAVSKPIIVQNYGLQAGSKQMQKKMELAADLYCKQAEKAIEYGLEAQSLSAWWLAYNAVKKKNKKRYETILVEAYNFGITIAPDVLKATCINFICADYYIECDKNNDKAKCDEIHAFMVTIDDENWRENVEEKRKEMEKRKLNLLNWF